MKRIYLLMLLFVSTTVAFAQRTVDLEVTIVKPTTSTVVSPGTGPFDIAIVVKNLGTDSLKSTTDSTAWFATISGSKISWTFNGNSGTDWLRYNRGLKVNDTMHMNFNGIGFPNYVSEKDSNRNFCWYAFPVGKKPSDTIKDPNTANNSKCVSFMFKKTKFPANISSTNTNDVVLLFPNPAQNSANFVFTTSGKEDVKIVVTDMTGRVVITENKGVMTAGSHSVPMDTKSLPNGTYTAQLYMGKEIITTKLVIEK